MRTIVPVAVLSMSVVLGWTAAGLAATRKVPEQFATVQAAVTAANPDDIVSVGAGTYVEQVTINKRLTLTGRVNQIAIIKAPAVMAGSKSIIVVTGGTNAIVTIKGLFIVGPGGAGCDSLHFGIRVQNNAKAIIKNNAILDIRDDDNGTISGCQNGVGIQVGLDSEAFTGRATITRNTIERFQKNGMTIDNNGSSAIVTGNTVTGIGPTAIIAQNGIQVSHGAKGTIRNNTIRNMKYTGPEPTADGGVLAFGPAANTVIKGNTIDQVDVGIFVTPDTGPIDNLTIDHNQVTGSTYEGFSLERVTNSDITFNKAEFNEGPGYVLYDSDNNIVDDNQANGNGIDGFILDVDSRNNKVRRNRADNNVSGVGFRDESTGNKTAGTANTYNQNVADNNPLGDSDPPGLAQ